MQCEIDENGYKNFFDRLSSKFRNDWDFSEEKTDKATFGYMKSPPSTLSLLSFILLLIKSWVYSGWWERFLPKTYIGWVDEVYI